MTCNTFFSNVTTLTTIFTGQSIEIHHFTDQSRELKRKYVMLQNIWNIYYGFCVAFDTLWKLLDQLTHWGTQNGGAKRPLLHHVAYLQEEALGRRLSEYLISAQPRLHNVLTLQEWVCPSMVCKWTIFTTTDPLGACDL